MGGRDGGHLDNRRCWPHLEAGTRGERAVAAQEEGGYNGSPASTSRGDSSRGGGRMAFAARAHTHCRERYIARGHMEELAAYAGRPPDIRRGARPVPQPVPGALYDS